MYNDYSKIVTSPADTTKVWKQFIDLDNNLSA